MGVPRWVCLSVVGGVCVVGVLLGVLWGSLGVNWGVCCWGCLLVLLGVLLGGLGVHWGVCCWGCVLVLLGVCV